MKISVCFINKNEAFFCFFKIKISLENGAQYFKCWIFSDRILVFVVKSSFDKTLNSSKTHCYDFWFLFRIFQNVYVFSIFKRILITKQSKFHFFLCLGVLSVKNVSYQIFENIFRKKFTVISSSEIFQKSSILTLTTFKDIFCAVKNMIVLSQKYSINIHPSKTVFIYLVSEQLWWKDIAVKNIYICSLHNIYRFE